MSRDDSDVDPEFAKKCSEITLQSKKEGFFLSYADSVEELLGEEWFQQTFSKLKTDEERIAICYSDPEVREAVVGIMQHVRPLYRAKDPVIAQQKLLDGRREMSNGNNAKAVVVLTQALLRAMPADSEPSKTLPHSLAARSEALLELGKYHESLQDLQLAIREGFPQHLRYQLYWRMSHCHRNLGETAKARVCLQLSLKLLEDATSNDQHAKTIILEEMKSLEMGDDKMVQLNETTMKPPVLPEVVGSGHPSLPGASSYLKVASDNDKGRHCVATTALSAGDCIVVEHPYASVLLPEMGGTHCHHCFQRLQLAVGCPQCSGVAFCSSVCRDKALSTYHQHECLYLGLMFGSGMSILSMLALRIITQEPEGLQFFQQVKQHLATQLKGSHSNTKPDIHIQQYLRVWNLETHKNKRNTRDFFQRTLMAVFLLRILQHGGKFFPKENRREEKDGEYNLTTDELLIGSLLLHHLQLLQFNAHEIFETVVKQEGIIQGSKTVYLGVGLYPTVSFFNHDCYPALARHFVGSALVLRALRPIRAGEEVPENYGPVYTKHSLDYRQKQLYCRYWFRCSCRSCTENWPDMDKLPNNKPRYRKGIGKRTNELNKQLSLLICDLFDPALKLMEEGNPPQAAKMFAEFINLTTRLGVRPPHSETQLAIDALRLCLADTANVFVLK